MSGGPHAARRREPEDEGDLCNWPAAQLHAEEERQLARPVCATPSSAKDRVGFGPTESPGDVDDLFDGHVNAAMAGAAKPARPIFDAAVEVGGARRAETVHVGDHPLYDVHGAREAGLRAVWVNRNGMEWPAEYDLPDAEVHNVGELVTLLAGTD